MTDEQVIARYGRDLVRLQAGVEQCLDDAKAAAAKRDTLAVAEHSANAAAVVRVMDRIRREQVASVRTVPASFHEMEEAARGQVRALRRLGSRAALRRV